jgi:Bacterial membrane protein YfhO
MVLGQADILFAHLPWETYRPLGQRIGNPLLTDVPTVFYPFLLHARTAILRGEFPLWSGSIGAGEPVFAAFQSAVLSPFTAIAYVLPFPGGLTAIAAAKLFVGGVGMYLFLRALPLCRAAAIVGGIIFLLNPFSVVWLEHPVSAAASWLPWLLLGVERCVNRCGGQTLSALAVVVMLTLLAGHPETGFKMFLLVGVYTVYRGVASGRPLRTVALVTAAGALGVLLSSIQLVPFLEYVSISRVLAERSGSGQPLFTNPPASFITAFVPDFYGTPLRRRFVLTGTNYCEQQIYAGVATWVLASIALLHRRFRGHALMFLGVGTVAVLVMYGTVVARAAILFLPPLRVAALSRFGLIAITGAAIAAAIGADAFFSADERDRQQSRRLAVVGTITASIIVVVVATFLYAKHDWLVDARQWSSTIKATAWTAILLGTTVTVLWSAPLLRRPVLTALTTVLLAVDLIVFADGFHPLMPRQHSFPKVPELEIPQKDPDVFRVAGWKDVLLPNTALVYGLQDFRGYDGLGLRSYSDLLNVGFHFDGSTHQIVHTETPHLIDVLNIKYVLTPQDIDLPPERFELLHDGRTRVYRNQRVQPRAFLADDFVLLDGIAALRAMRNGDVDLRRVAVLDRQVEPAQRPDRAVDSPGTAVIQRYTDGAVSVETRAEGKRLLVLTDVYYPGWTASVDGAPVPVLRADHAFRAVAVPPGRHIVEFRYRPDSIRYGAILSGAGLVLLGLLLWPRWPKRRYRRDSITSSSTALPGRTRSSGRLASGSSTRPSMVMKSSLSGSM